MSDLVVVVVHQTSNDISFGLIQLLKHVGRVGGEVDQLLLTHHFLKVLWLYVDVLGGGGGLYGTGVNVILSYPTPLSNTST